MEVVLPVGVLSVTQDNKKHSVLELSVLSAQFCCKSKTALNKYFFLNEGKRKKKADGRLVGVTIVFQSSKVNALPYCFHPLLFSPPWYLTDNNNWLFLNCSISYAESQTIAY